MFQRFSQRVLLAVVLLFATEAASVAAEIRLKSHATCNSEAVTLGDVADIYGDDKEHAAKLRKISLFPALAPGERKKISIRQLQEVLQLHGINLIKNRMSGASTIELSREATAVVAKTSLTTPVFLSTAARTRAKKKAEQSIAWFLRTYVDAETDWRVQVETSPAMLAALDKNSRILAASTNQETSSDPQQWVGRRTFTLTSPQAGSGVVLEVEAEISLPEFVVVVSRAVRRGEILRADDLQISSPPRTRLVEPIYNLKEAVGKEVKHSLSPGQALVQAVLQSPRLVQRNDIVTVYVRGVGVRIRTMARALEEGGRGDVVAVQSLDAARRKHLARVSDYQVVEILAAGPSMVRPTAN